MDACRGFPTTTVYPYGSRALKFINPRLVDARERPDHDLRSIHREKKEEDEENDDGGWKRRSLPRDRPAPITAGERGTITPIAFPPRSSIPLYRTSAGCAVVAVLSAIKPLGADNYLLRRRWIAFARSPRPATFPSAFSFSRDVPPSAAAPEVLPAPSSLIARERRRYLHTCNTTRALINHAWYQLVSVSETENRSTRVVTRVLFLSFIVSR